MRGPFYGKRLLREAQRCREAAHLLPTACLRRNCRTCPGASGQPRAPAPLPGSREASVSGYESPTQRLPSWRRRARQRARRRARSSSGPRARHSRRACQASCQRRTSTDAYLRYLNGQQRARSDCAQQQQPARARARTPLLPSRACQASCQLTACKRWRAHARTAACTQQLCAAAAIASAPPCMCVNQGGGANAVQAAACACSGKGRSTHAAAVYSSSCMQCARASLCAHQAAHPYHGCMSGGVRAHARAAACTQRLRAAAAPDDSCASLCTRQAAR